MKLGQACIVGLAAMGLPSCSPPGEVIAVISTDMTLQKDIDRIRIVVKYEGGQTFSDNTYDRVGDSSSPTPIKLPATLGILANDENRPLRLKVMAFRGRTTEDLHQIRVVRDAVFTVPQDGIFTLPMPIEFLCDGFAKVKTDPMTGKPILDENGDPVYESKCEAGKTCRAGKCDSEDEVDNGDFEPYVPGRFPTGENTTGKTCFDSGICFESATALDVDVAAFNADKSICRATVPPALLMGGAFNVGLATEGSGTCNASGCFVPLDAPSDNGWGDASTIALPVAICEKFINGQIARVVAAPVGPAPCAQKRASIPTCDPKPSDPNQPSIVVDGQINLNAFIVDDSGIYWTMQGKLDMTGIPGAVKMVAKTGGTPSVVAETKGVPQGLVVDNSRGFVLWTDATGDANGTIGWAKFGVPTELSTNTLIAGLVQPAGVGVVRSMHGAGIPLGIFKDVVFTEFGGDRVIGVRTEVRDGVLTNISLPASGSLYDNVVPAGVAPFSVVGGGYGGSPAEALVCFGYQGTTGNADGVVACYDRIKNATTAIKTNLQTPRSLVFQENTSGVVVALYFVELDANGAIWRADYTPGTGFSPAVNLNIPGVSFPTGLAIDTTVATPILYYTSLDQGTVNAFDVVNGTTPIATNRKNPGAVAVDDKYVYWIEGTPNMQDGAIFKIAKQ